MKNNNKKAMKKQEKAPKGCIIITAIAVVAIGVYITVQLFNWIMTPSKDAVVDHSQVWSTMTYEERDEFLTKAMENRTIAGESQLEEAVRSAIRKEVVNPSTLRFEWLPSIYNGLAYVVEADSGFIYVPFKCSAKNDFGIKKELMGSVMYEYLPETNSLQVKRWDLEQNN